MSKRREGRRVKREQRGEERQGNEGQEEEGKKERMREVEGKREGEGK